ncbi:MAG: hypothetical protein AAF496_13675, partial [Pseudomonadota bacterium]
AIIRQLLGRRGIGVAQANPHGAELPKLIRRLQDCGEDRFKAVLIHTHSWDDETADLFGRTPFTAGFANFRDPRDVAVSLRKLHELPFENALEATTQYFKLFHRTALGMDVLVIPYEQLAAAKQSYIFQIGRRLGFWPKFDELAEIDQETSVDRHKAVMEQVKDGKLDTLQSRQNRHRKLVEDSKTLINDRHIQSGASGRWRTELTEDEQAAANEKFAAIIQRYGYEST